MKAVKVGLKQKVRSLQRLMSKSLAAKLIAIKREISNNGKRPPGVDNMLIDDGFDFLDFNVTPRLLLLNAGDERGAEQEQKR